MGAASNVIFGKARAMYGRRVRPEQLEALLACRSVPDIAGYLKQNTAYASVLRDADERQLHRGRLEQLLRRKQTEEVLSLCRYESSIGRALSRFLEQRIETEWLTRYLYLLSEGTAADFYWKDPPLLPVRTRICAAELIRVTRFDEVAELLRDTPYGRVLSMKAPEGTVPVAAAVNALHTRLREELHAVIEHTHGTEQEELRSLCGGRDDTENAVRLYRILSRFPEERAFASLLPPGGTLRPREQQALRAAQTPEEVVRIFFRSETARRIPERERPNVGDWELWQTFETAARLIRFSQHPTVVLMAYDTLMEIERNNLVRLIEGVRYGMTAEQIRPMLVV